MAVISGKTVMADEQGAGQPRPMSVASSFCNDSASLGFHFLKVGQAALFLCCFFLSMKLIFMHSYKIPQESHFPIKHVSGCHCLFNVIKLSDSAYTGIVVCL